MAEHQKITDFAFVKEQTKEGKLLSIVGKDYQAWNYDYYIYDAIALAKKWQPHQITYSRITHLRDWVRENIQHGHNFPTSGLSSMRSVKLWIDMLIEAEYGHDCYWDEQKKASLKDNAEIFSLANNRDKGGEL